MSRSNPVIRNFSRLLCSLFKVSKLSLLIWFGVKTGDLCSLCKEQNLSPGAGWLVQHKQSILKDLSKSQSLTCHHSKTCSRKLSNSTFYGSTYFPSCLLCYNNYIHQCNIVITILNPLFNLLCTLHQR